MCADWLIAWPARYGNTGVMSFMLNQNKQLYQKDLGPHTKRVALAVGVFDPDPSWEPVHS